MKKIAANLLLIVIPLLALFAAAPTAAQDTTDDARKLLDSLVDNYLENIDSHKYNWHAYGNDRFSKERQKNISGNYESMAKKKGAEVEAVSEEPEIKRGLYEIEFMKPYLVQMKVVKSDFIPKAVRSFVFGTLVTYRSDKLVDVWWAKLKFSPIALKKSVEKDDAGGALTSGWTNALLNLIYFSGNAAGLSMQPDAEFDGRNCKVLRLTFDWEKTPEWNHEKPPFDKFQAPEQIEKIIWDGMLEVEQQKFDYIDYFIDAEKNILLKIEEYIDGKLHWRNSFTDIELNTLTEEDF
ncbi:MAG: hypothetical protein ABIH66_09380 [bacterium]